MLNYIFILLLPFLITESQQMEKKIEITAVDNFSDAISKIQKEQTNLYDSYIKQVEKGMSAEQKERAERLKIYSEQKKQISDITKLKIEAVKNETDTTIRGADEQKKRQIEAAEIRYKQELKIASELIGKEKEKKIKQAEAVKEKAVTEAYDIWGKQVEGAEKREPRAIKEILMGERRYIRQLESREQKEYKSIQNEENKERKDKIIKDKQYDSEKKREEILVRREDIRIQKEKQKEEKDELNDRKRARRKVWSAGETGINQSIQGIGQALSQNNIYGASVSTLGAVGSSAASLIPGIGGILGTSISAATQIITSALSAARQTEESRIMTSNLAGRTAGRVSFLSEAESGSLFTSISKQRGRATYSEIRQQLELERQMGYNPNELGGINRFERLMKEDQSTATLMKDFLRAASKSKLWDVDKEDFSNIGSQVTSGLVPLLQREAEISDTVTGRRSILAQTRFASLGGGWADAQMGSSRIQAIDQMIRNPQNPFVDMLIKSSILKNNPGANLMNLMDVQAQGVMNLQTFGTTLSTVKKLSPEMQHLALMNMLPNLQGNYQARQALLQNADIFSQGMDETSIEKTLLSRGTNKDIVRDIMKNATVGAQKSAELQVQETMVKLGDRIVKILEPHIPKLTKMADLLIDLVDYTIGEKPLSKAEKDINRRLGLDYDKGFMSYKQFEKDPEFSQFMETGDIVGLTKEQLKIITANTFKELSGNIPYAGYSMPFYSGLEKNKPDWQTLSYEQQQNEIRKLILSINNLINDNKAFRNNRLTTPGTYNLNNPTLNK